MQRNIFKTSTICLSFLIIFTNNTSEVNNNYFITILKKITSKGDFTAKILDIASIIKTKNEEEINLESIKQFTESDRGKKLNNAFNNALDQNFQQQSAISKIGHFLYDFYQSNIFGNQTKNIGKILEFYLLTFHKITVAINFDTIKSSKDLILRHRLLFEQKIIDDALYTLIKTVNLIRYAPLEKLTDIDYLENKLLLELGLNNANLHEFPSHLTEHYGKGLKYWGYPAQFAKYLISLSQLPLNSYLEVNAEYRGTFIIVTEYLRRFNPHLKSCIIDPHYSLMLDLYTNELNQNTEYILDFSSSNRFIDLKNTTWDIAFIESGRSFQDISGQYNLLKNNAHILVFQDIINDAVPGIANFWNLIKKVYYKKNKIDEFTDQYEEVTKSQNKKYMGIGVIYKDILK